MLPIECVVRGYLSGSGLEGLPADRRGVRDRAARPACASPTGCPSRSSPRRPRRSEGHDENIDFERAAELVGDRALAERVRDVSIAVYEHAAEHARERGIILADTKFEFGLDADGELTLGDEVCTPDSSRFWPADRVRARARAAELRQAVRARLGVVDRLGPEPAGAGDPRRRRRAHAREVRRGLRADHRRAVRRLAGAAVRHRRGPRPAR